MFWVELTRLARELNLGGERVLDLWLLEYLRMISKFVVLATMEEVDCE